VMAVQVPLGYRSRIEWLCYYRWVPLKVPLESRLGPASVPLESRLRTARYRSTPAGVPLKHRSGAAQVLLA
jgi:hypothetical protein